MRQVRQLRRRYPDVWAAGQGTGYMRCERRVMGQGDTPFPPTRDGRIERGFLEAEDATYELRLRMTLHEGMPEHLIDGDALEAFHWGFIQGWNEYLAADPGRIAPPPKQRPS